jgi:hypothetical protein
MSYVTTDGMTLVEGQRAFNFNDLEAGVIGKANPLRAGWFDFHQDNGEVKLLNGERICSMLHAVVTGWAA